MRSMIVWALSIGAMLGLAAAPAAAQPAVEAAQRWGLVGAWQGNCAAAPNEEYPRSVFEVRNGALVYERFSGEGNDSAPITAATIRPDGAIALTLDFTQAGGPREWVLGKTDNNRFHTLSNRSLTTGVYSVRNGLLVGNGQPTPWNHRCAGAVGR